MNTKSLIRAFAREDIQAVRNSKNSKYYACGKKFICHWCDCGGLAVGVRVSRISDIDDSREDYSGGSFVKNIKQAVEWTKEI